jgi:hypothetical protein
LGALLGVSAGSAVLAQDVPQVGNKRAADVHATLLAGYDTNAADSNAAQAAIRGLALHDFLFRPSLNLNLVQIFGRQALFTRGEIGYDFHRQNQQLNTKRLKLQTGAAALFGPCQAVAAAGYSTGHSELVQIQGPSATNIYRDQTAVASVQCARAIGFTAGAVVNSDKITNSDPSEKQSNARTHGASLTLGYGGPSIGQLGIVGRYSASILPNRIVLPGNAPGDRLLVRSLGASYTKKFGSKLTATAVLSRAIVKRGQSVPGIPSKSTATTYSGDLVYRLSPRITFEAIGSRAILPSSFPGKLYDIDQNAELSGSYRLGKGIQIKIGGRLEDDNSNVGPTFTGTPGAAVAVVTRARTETAYASVRYRQNKRIAWVLDVQRDSRRTNLPSFNYSGMTINLSTDITF